MSDFFRFIGETAVHLALGLSKGKKPKVRVALEWEDGDSNRPAYSDDERTETTARTGEKEVGYRNR